HLSCSLLLHLPPLSTLFPYTTLFRSYERQAVLAHCVTRFQERADELAHALCIEAGKPIRDSRGEVSRLIDTFRIAAEESVRMTGDRKSTRLNSSHVKISYAVFCLKKK